MFVKSIMISTAAALLGPTIGLALFFMANSGGGGKATLPTTREGLGIELGEPEVLRNFEPQGVHLDLASIHVPERRLRSPRLEQQSQPRGALSLSAQWVNLRRTVAAPLLKPFRHRR